MARPQVMKSFASGPTVVQTASSSSCWGLSQQAEGDGRGTAATLVESPCAAIAVATTQAGTCFGAPPQD